MRTWFFVIIVVMALVTGACSSTFLVYKNGQGYYLGSDSQASFDLLCTSGEMERVLLATSLSKEKKDSLYQYTCSAERSGDKIKQIYASMTAGERKDIRHAFRKNGYEINHMLC